MRKRTVFIFHGTGGHPRENWFPWLAKALRKRRCRVIVPQFPTPKNQNLKSWMKVFARYEKLVDSKTIFIGHSLGGTFLLSVLAQLSCRVRAAFFIAPPLGILPTKFYKTDLPFTRAPYRWSRIKMHCRKFYVFHSEDDTFISVKNGRKLAKSLGIKLHLEKTAGHFNAIAGYKKFDMLLKKLRPLL